MNLSTDERIKMLEDWAASDAGRAFFERERLRNELKESRFRRFEEYVKTIDFDDLMYRLILEHGDDWCAKCREKGFTEHPNNKLGFLIDYLVHNHESIQVQQLDCPFTNEVWFYKGYYFQMIWGQGVITKIYNKDDMKEILCL